MELRLGAVNLRFGAMELRLGAVNLRFGAVELRLAVCSKRRKELLYKQEAKYRRPTLRKPC